MRRKPSLYSLAAAAVALGAATANAEDIKVGALMSMTGDLAAYGESSLSGIQLAVKEINAADGVLGSQIEFIIHDSQTDPAVAAQTATQFVEEDQVSAFVGYDDSDSVIATAPIFQAAGIPYITVGATSPKLPSQLGDMVFLAAFGDNVQAAAGGIVARALL